MDSWPGLRDTKLGQPVNGLKGRPEEARQAG